MPLLFLTMQWNYCNFQVTESFKLCFYLTCLFYGISNFSVIPIISNPLPPCFIFNFRVFSFILKEVNNMLIIAITINRWYYLLINVFRQVQWRKKAPCFGILSQYCMKLELNWRFWVLKLIPGQYFWSIYIYYLASYLQMYTIKLSHFISIKQWRVGGCVDTS